MLALNSASLRARNFQSMCMCVMGNIGQIQGSNAVVEPGHAGLWYPGWSLGSVPFWLSRSVLNLRMPVGKPMQCRHILRAWCASVVAP